MVKIDLLILRANCLFCFAEVICYSFQETSHASQAIPACSSLVNLWILVFCSPYRFPMGLKSRFCAHQSITFTLVTQLFLYQERHMFWVVMLGCQPRPSFAANTWEFLSELSHSLLSSRFLPPWHTHLSIVLSHMHSLLKLRTKSCSHIH